MNAKIDHSKKSNKKKGKSVNGSINSTGRYNNIFRIVFCFGIIFILSAIVFSPTLNNGFTNWDDEEYVVNNSHIKGLTLHNIVKVFSTIYVANYQPLTMLSYMLDYHFFQLNPMGYHAMSLLFHIANSLLVFIIIYSLTGKKLTSLFGALLFAIHPLRVESVAWVAERKDVLSAFFYFFTILLYIQYLKISIRKVYYLGIVSFLFSLLCKPMAVSLPIILLLVYYLLNGIPNKKAIINTIPFFVISAVFSVVTLFAQNVLMPVGTDTFSLSIMHRLCIPFYGILFYIVKTIFPLRLCSFYPFPGNERRS